MAADEPCDCGGCAEFQAVHARLCAELPPVVRAAKRAVDRAAQRRYEDAMAETTPTLHWAV